MTMEREDACVANESSFEDFLVEDKSLDEVDAIALKRVIIWKLSEKMTADGITKTEMARSMSTSRSQIDRLLDPEKSAIQLDTVAKAAHVLGLKMQITFEDDKSPLELAE